MLEVKRSKDIGYVDHGWLKSHHSFSFASYYDPDNMHFSYLRVINDDIIGPDHGFAQHPHNNMEIFTYVLDGELQHKDTLGTGSIIKAGDVQLMSTGYGVQHSEYNPSHDKSVHLLQIWVIPNQKDTQPTYQQVHFPIESKLNRLKLIISDAGQEDSMIIKQDVKIYASVLEEGHKLHHTNYENRCVYIQIAKGHLKVNSFDLKAGDALMVTGEESLTITSVGNSEFLLFDLPVIN